MGQRLIFYPCQWVANAISTAKLMFMPAPWPIRKLVQWKFKRTSRKKGDAQIREHMQAYVDLLGGLTDEQACHGFQVGKMLGVDEDMRGWSLCEIIEHNTIVNHALKARVLSLLTGEMPDEYANFDVKKDVMPGLGEEFRKANVDQFVESVEGYLDSISSFENLKTERTAEHPVFGTFNAHQFHIMFGFHLGLHLNQANAVVAAVRGA